MAATGTPTPNIGLRIPQGTDPASVDDINYNSNLLDTKLGAVGNTSVQDQIDSLNSKLTVQTVTNLNDATETGFYYFASNASNIPRTNTAGTLFVIVGGSNLVTQLVISSNYLYVRRKVSGSWNEWAEK